MRAAAATFAKSSMASGPAMLHRKSRRCAGKSIDIAWGRRQIHLARLQWSHCSSKEEGK
jgi:hypothetical protein